MLLTPQEYARPNVLELRLSMLRDSQISMDSMAQSKTATASLPSSRQQHVQKPVSKSDGIRMSSVAALIIMHHTLPGRQLLFGST